MHFSRVISIAFAVIAVTSFVPIAALALPDLTPEIPDVALIAGENVEQGDVDEGCASSMAGRTLVRFSDARIIITLCDRPQCATQ